MHLCEDTFDIMCEGGNEEETQSNMLIFGTKTVDLEGVEELGVC